MMPPFPNVSELFRPDSNGLPTEAAPTEMRPLEVWPAEGRFAEGDRAEGERAGGERAGVRLPWMQWQVQLYRLLTLLGASLLSLFGVSKILVLEAGVPAWGLLGAAGLLAGLFGVSYGPGWTRRHYVAGLKGTLYLMMGGFIIYAAWNRFGGSYVGALLLAHALLTLIMWAGAQSTRPVLRSAGFGVLVTPAAAVVGPVPPGRALVVILSVGAVAAVEWVIIRAFLSYRWQLRGHRQGQLRSITENVSDGIYRSVPGEGIVYANHAFAEMFGYECVEEILQIDPDVLYHDPKEREQRIEDLQTQQTFDEHEIEFRRKDGTTFTGLLSGTVVRGPEGEVKCFDGAVTDITEQKEAKRALQAERDRYETLFENLPTPVARSTAEGGKARIADVNQAFEAVFNADASAIEGRDLSTLFASGPDEEGPLKRRNPDARMLEKKIQRAEMRRQTADGQRDFRLQVTSRMQEDGTPEVYTIYTDITAQKEAERTLREEQTALRRMYRITAKKGMSFGSKIRRLLALGREYLGLSYGFLTRISEGEQEIMHVSGSHELLRRGATCPLSEAYCQKTVEQESLVSIQDAPSEGWAEDPAYHRFDLGSYIGAQVRLEEKTYGTFCFASDQARSVPFSEREKTFVELMAQWTSYEIEQRRDKERLQRQNERLDSFASVLSHDLRNPLHTAVMNLDLARESDDPVHLTDIGYALDRMSRIIQDVLTLTRSGDIDPEELSPVHLPPLVQASWSQVDTAQATLQDETDAMVRADKRRLQRLLENLFRNAVEHGGKEATVRVGDLPTGFFVEDNGPGIPADRREKVFDEGYSSSHDGTGLGLSIVETIVDGHGWTLSVTNGPAGGARFEIEGADVAEAESSH